MVAILAIKTAAIKWLFLQNSDVLMSLRLKPLVRDIRGQLLERNVPRNVSNLKLPVQMVNAKRNVLN